MKILNTDIGFVIVNKGKYILKIEMKNILYILKNFTKIKKINLYNKYIIYNEISFNEINSIVKEVLDDGFEITYNLLESRKVLNWLFKYIDDDPIDYNLIYDVSYEIYDLGDINDDPKYSFLSVEVERKDQLIHISYKKKDIIIVYYYLLSLEYEYSNWYITINNEKIKNIDYNLYEKLLKSENLNFVTNESLKDNLQRKTIVKFNDYDICVCEMIKEKIQ